MKIYFYALSTDLINGTSGDICGDIRSRLPKYCSVPFCIPSVSMNVRCGVRLLNSLDLSVEVDAKLCAKPVSLNVTVVVPIKGVVFSKTVAGSIRYPVPGVAIDIGGLAKAGLFVIVTLNNNAGGQFSVSIALQACAKAFGFEKCLPSPPFNVYSLNFNINGICLK